MPLGLGFVSYETVNFPGKYIALRDFVLMVDDSGENVEAKVARLELTKELAGPTPLYYDHQHQR